MVYAEKSLQGGYRNGHFFFVKKLFWKEKKSHLINSIHNKYSKYFGKLLRFSNFGKNKFFELSTMISDFWTLYFENTNTQKNGNLGTNKNDIFSDQLQQ